MKEKEKVFLQAHKEGKIKVTPEGKVYHSSGREMGYLDNNGYLATAIKRNGRTFHMLNHRIIYMCLANDNLGDLHINHKNCNKLDNSLSNLELVTIAENNKHARENGLQPPMSDKAKKKLSESQMGEKAINARFKNSEVLEIRRLHSTGLSMRQIGRMFKVNHQSISNIVKNKRYKIAG